MNKAHGHDEVSIRMLKLCESAITEPLNVIFKNCLSSNASAKKLSSCASVTDLICGKMFEKLLFNALYSFFEDHKLLNPFQSGFKKNDSCINQLVSITHEIYSAFDYNPSLEVQGVFLDLSKAFDKVWYNGLIYKLKSLGISGSLLKLIQNYLDNQFQRVLLNGQTSESKPVKQVFPSVQFLDHYFFWFILIIFVVIYQLILNSSLMILLFFL